MPQVWSVSCIDSPVHRPACAACADSVSSRRWNDRALFVEEFAPDPKVDHRIVLRVDQRQHRRCHHPAGDVDRALTMPGSLPIDIARALGGVLDRFRVASCWTGGAH